MARESRPTREKVNGNYCGFQRKCRNLCERGGSTHLIFLQDTNALVFGGVCAGGSGGGSDDLLAGGAGMIGYEVRF